MAKKQCVREVRPDQMRKLCGEGNYCRIAADRNNDVSAVELDQLARFLGRSAVTIGLKRPPHSV
jgi:hypothetical protein